MSLSTIESIELQRFVSSSYREQKNILSRVKVDVHDEADVKLLRKYIAMKVLMEARYSAENHGVWNVAAQFRGLLAYFGLNDLVLGADIGQENDRILYQGEQGSVRNGYRLFHISDMGLDNWNRKFFNIGLDDEYNIVTQRVNTKDS